MMLIIFLKINLTFLPSIPIKFFSNSPINGLFSPICKIKKANRFFLSIHFTNQNKEGNE